MIRPAYAYFARLLLLATFLPMAAIVTAQMHISGYATALPSDTVFRAPIVDHGWNGDRPSVDLTAEGLETTYALDDTTYHLEAIDPDLYPTYQVGEIPYTTRISEGGQVVIDVPLDLHLQPHECDPKLSLHFEGRSLTDLGVGWSLTGLPVITRAVGNYFTDGGISPINWQDNTCWSLNGIRLIYQGNNTYLSQTGNIKVTWDTNTSAFTVWYPNGDKALLNLSSAENTLSYHASSITSSDGRQVNFGYRDTGGRLLLNFVNLGSGHLVRLYHDDTDTIAGNEVVNRSRLWVAGHELTYNRHLTQIAVYKNNALLSRYNLIYPSGLVEAGITSIEREDAYGRRQPPLQFAYHSTGRGSVTVGTTRLDGDFTGNDMSRMRISTGKFDLTTESDGLLILPDKLPYVRNGNTIGSGYAANDDILVAPWIEVSPDTDVGYVTMNAGSGFVDAFAMDVDGVRGDELVVLHDNKESSTNRLTATIYSLRLQGTVMTAVQQRQATLTLPLLGVGSSATICPKTFLHGDFDGDGREELAIITPSNPLGVSGFEARIRLVNLYDGSVKGSFPLSGYTLEIPTTGDNTPLKRHLRYRGSERMTAIDIDGDGKTEILHVTPDGTARAYRFAINTDGATILNDTINSGSIGHTSLSDISDYAITATDVNGDGTGDLLLSHCAPAIGQGELEAATYLGHGDGTFAVDTTFYATAVKNYPRRYHTADLDRDGRAEVLIPITADTIAARSTHGINAGRVFTLALPAAAAIAGTSQYGATDNFKTIALAADGTLKLYGNTRMGDIDHRLAAIKDSRGINRHYRYTRQYHAHSDDYHAPSGPVFPFAANAASRLVCSGERATAGDSIIVNNNYRYGTGIVHRQGLGFMCFDKITAIDSLTMRKTVSNYDHTKFGALTHRQLRAAGGIDLQSHTETATATVTSDKRIRVDVTATVDTDALTCVTVTAAADHDSYGNVTSSTVTTNDGWAAATTTTYNNVTNDANHYLIGLPLSTSTTTSHGGNTSTTLSGFTYNSAYQPLTQSDYIGDTAHRKRLTRYTYNSNHDLTGIYHRDYGSTQWVKRLYGYTGHRLMTATDEHGIKSTFRYDRFGISTIETDRSWMITHSGEMHAATGGIGGDSTMGMGDEVPNPGDIPGESTVATTTIGHDSFGRACSVTSPAGTTTSDTLMWVPSGIDLPQALWLRQRSTDGQPTIRTFYDRRGQVVRTAAERPDSGWVNVDSRYDARGRLIARSQPFTTGTPQWTTFVYDNYDRVIAAHKAGACTDSYSYNGLTTTSTVDGVTTTRVSDSQGLLLSSTDVVGNTITYAYRADGQLSSMVCGDAATAIEYDAYGRRTAVIDPSAGRREFAYDTYGNQTTVTDARGRAVTTTADALGDVSTITATGMPTVTYTRGGDGLVTSVAVDGVTRHRYSRDIDGRLNSVTDGRLRRAYNYDPDGKLTSTRYFVDNELVCVEGYERSGGTVTAVWLDSLNNTAGVHLLGIEAMDDAGRATALTAGALEMSLNYDAVGRVVSRQASNATGSVIQEMNYGYDNKGNMVWRRDDTRPATGTETFTYDALNRLTAYGGATATYNAIGDITAKSAVGAYTYDSDSPYAVESVDDLGSMAWERQQTITYNSLQRPDSITEGGVTVSSVYAANGELLTRITDRTGAGGGVKTVVHHGTLLTETTTRQGAMSSARLTLWVGGTSPYDAVAALTRDGDGPWHLHRVLRDNQGSVVLVTDSAGVVEQELSYDAWGALRDPETHAVYGAGAVPEPMLDGRGYTSHEHLTDFALIDMNARLYDAALSRFLNPDPDIQWPDNPQNLNRYSYCLNNPLRYTDPTGRDNETKKNLENIIVIGKPYKPIIVNPDFEYKPIPLKQVTTTRPEATDKPITPSDADDRNRLITGGGGFSGIFSSATVPSIKPAPVNLVPYIPDEQEEDDDYFTPTVSLALFLAQDHYDTVHGYIEITVNQALMDQRINPQHWNYKTLQYKIGHKQIANGARIAGNILNSVALANSINDLVNATTTEQQIEYSLDTFFSAIGFIPTYFTVAMSLYWSLGGKQLTYYWYKYGLLNEEKKGVLGLPSVQPFK